MPSLRSCIGAFALGLAATLGSAAPLSAQHSDVEFDRWLGALKQEAISKGIRAETVESALAGVTPIARVLEKDRSQREFTLTFTRYLRNSVTDTRVERARRLLEEHRVLLERVEAKYGVQPRFLVSFWGLESNFGEYTGGFPVIGALATLAQDSRRSAFFRSELLNALQILDEGHISVERMSGSWAGAMGQLQFIPSTFVNFAVDFDGDGKRDIWNSLPDIFASAANYLSQEGWRGDETWGREVKLPPQFDHSQASLGIAKPLREWSETYGIRKNDGGRLPTADLEASIILPSGHRGPAFLAYKNYRTILIWNRSILYALAVGHLADRIAGGAALASLPDEQPISLQAIEEMQALLNAKGFDAGEPDGLVGRQTRAALSAYQRSIGEPADGYPTLELIEKLRAQ
ncbi:lytic murein transglycosylase [Pelagibius litoralis]|uniref:Lytic murein transglycosylase n=1 Tax=Pelagibius litoralis TaxID=374515 RepID=A0A967EUV2_9PROT|nr:lytic murein transglycosylase [Pelagibius litoralis]NIA67746.1 lytic murein transglycosylase [Pelagibius litoralis]